MARGQGRITENELHSSLTQELDRIYILNGTGEVKEKANKTDLDEHKNNANNPHNVNKNQIELVM